MIDYKRKIFFASSLPRSGSTLLQNILSQNDAIYASPTSGLLELVYAARNEYTNSKEFLAQDANLMKKAFLSFCAGGFHGYYDAITDKPIVIDKSRGHFIHYDFISQFVPNPKMICMVRRLEDIVSSMEKLYRNNQHKATMIINHATMQGTTTGKRVRIFLNSAPIGLALERLHEAILQGIDKKMLFVRYEDLCLRPIVEMKRIYEYLGIMSEWEHDKHDFNNIEQVTKEDDSIYGLSDLHSIRTKLEPLQSDAERVLGADIISSLKSDCSWFYKYFNYL